MNERETRIREWAYRLWEEEGYPHGRDAEHWFRAVAIVTEEDSQQEAGPDSVVADEAEPATASEPAPEIAAEPMSDPAPDLTPKAAAKPKAARPKKASPEATVTEAPAPVPPGRRKRS